MRALAFVVVLGIVATWCLAHRETHEVYTCFLHCHGEPPKRIETLGAPFPYATVVHVPGDPPTVQSRELAPLPLLADLALVGLLAFLAWAGGVAVAITRARERARYRAAPRLPAGVREAG